jgi:hypothetical protein
MVLDEMTRAIVAADCQRNGVVVQRFTQRRIQQNILGGSTSSFVLP